MLGFSLANLGRRSGSLFMLETPPLLFLVSPRFSFCCLLRLCTLYRCLAKSIHARFLSLSSNERTKKGSARNRKPLSHLLSSLGSVFKRRLSSWSRRAEQVRLEGVEEGARGGDVGSLSFALSVCLALSFFSLSPTFSSSSFFSSDISSTDPSLPKAQTSNSEATQRISSRSLSILQQDLRFPPSFLLLLLLLLLSERKRIAPPSYFFLTTLLLHAPCRSPFLPTSSLYPNVSQPPLPYDDDGEEGIPSGRWWSFCPLRFPRQPRPRPRIHHFYHRSHAFLSFCVFGGRRVEGGRVRGGWGWGFHHRRRRRIVF